MFRKEVEDIGDFADDGLWVPSHTTEGFGGWGRAGRQAKWEWRSHVVTTVWGIQGKLACPIDGETGTKATWRLVPITRRQRVLRRL